MSFGEATVAAADETVVCKDERGDEGGIGFGFGSAGVGVDVGVLWHRGISGEGGLELVCGSRRVQLLKAFRKMSIV